MDDDVKAAAYEAYLRGKACLDAGDREGAQAAFEEAVRLGERKWPAYELAKLLRVRNPKRADEALHTSAEAGNEFAALELAPRLERAGDIEGAKRFYQQALDAGQARIAAGQLALLVQRDDPERAEALFGQAIEAGAVAVGCNDLGLLVQEKDPERAKALFERAIEAGNERFATNNLANLIVSEEPEAARSLYERAIAAGDEFWATCNLGMLVEPEDCEAAKALYRRAVAAGDRCRAAAELGRMLVDDGELDEAARLLEGAVEAGNPAALTSLAFAIEGKNPERANELYRRAIEAGFPYPAANNLANNIAKSDPEEAARLYELAIESTEDAVPRSNYGELLFFTDPVKAEALLREACEIGGLDQAPLLLATLIARKDPEQAKEMLTPLVESNDVEVAKLAKCRLAHLTALEDLEGAIGTYEELAKDGVTEALYGISYITASIDLQRSAQLLDLATQQDDFESSLRYITWLSEKANLEFAMVACKAANDNGYAWAHEAVQRLSTAMVETFGISKEEAARRLNVRTADVEENLKRLLSCVEENMRIILKHKFLTAVNTEDDIANYCLIFLPKDDPEIVRIRKEAVDLSGASPRKISKKADVLRTSIADKLVSDLDLRMNRPTTALDLAGIWLGLLACESFREYRARGHFDAHSTISNIALALITQNETFSNEKLMALILARSNVCLKGNVLQGPLAIGSFDI